MTEVNSTPDLAVKPNCYECMHRGEVPGSAHSSCQHPDAKEITTNPLAGLIGIMGRRSGFTSIDVNGTAAKLNVRGADLGIRRGWFLWPVNFDPVWLESCDGFTPKSAVRESARSDPGEGYTCAQHRGEDVAR